MGKLMLNDRCYTGSDNLLMLNDESYSGGELAHISYLKWKITDTRSNPSANALQLSEFYLYLNGELYNWNSNVSITASLASASAGESIENIIDGDIDTKYTTTQWGVSYVGQCEIVISLGETITINNNTTYAYATANDEPSRDPTGWALWGSSDGSNWFVLDARDGANVPTARKTSTEKFNINVGGGSSVEYKNYLKFNGEGIILPWTIDADYKVEVTFYETEYRNDTAIIGNTNGPSYFHVTEYSNNYFYSKQYNLENHFGPWVSGEHTIIYNDGTGHMQFDGTVVGDCNITSDSNVYLQLGGRGSRTSAQAYYGYIKAFKIYSIANDTLLHDLRPATIYGKPCFFDTVETQMYTNSTVTAVDAI